MATLANAYVQVIPSAQGIKGSLTNLMNGEASAAGSASGDSLAGALFNKAKSALVGLGIGKMVADTIANTGDFETTMAKVSTLFTGTGAEFEALQQKILAVSSETGMAATTLAEAAYSAESASVPMELLGTMIESSAKLAVAGFTDVDTALSATAKTMNSYGMTGEEAMQKVQNVLIQTQNKGITTVGELGASLANVTPTAAAMGVTFEQVGASLALMTAKGVPTAQATTQLRSAMTELGKSGTKADQAFREAANGTKYAGMGFKEAMAAGANLGDVFGMMQSYADATGQSMVDLWGSVEAGNAAMMIASDIETFNADLEAMSTTADVVGDSYETMASSFGNSMNKLKESAKNFMTTLFQGGDISASFDSMLQAAGDIGEKLLTWITNGIGGIADSLPSMIGSLIDFGAGLLESISGVNWLDLGTRIIQGLIGGLGELETNLLPTISGAITNAFGAVGEILPTIMQTGADITQNLLDGLNTAAPGIAEAINSILTSISTAITGAFPAISDGIANIVTAVEPLVTNITSTFAEVAPIVTQAILDIIAGLAPYIPAITEMVTETVAKLPEIISSFNGIVETITGAITSVVEALAPYIPAITEMVTETVAKIPEIVDSFNGIVETISGAITSVVEAVAPYIPAITEMVTETVAKLPEIINSFNGIVETISSCITSVVEAVAPYIPSIAEIVETTVTTLPEIVTAFQGIAESIPPIIESIGGVIGTIGTAISGVIDSIGTNVTQIVDAFSGLFESLSEPIDSISGAIGQISTAISGVVESVVTNMAGIVEAFSGLFESLSGPIQSIGSLIESIGTAIGTVVEAVGSCVANINESFAHVLDSLKGVIDSIGDGAVKAGNGFSTLADAIIKLVNQTGFFDLAATLGAVADAVGKIANTGKNAGDAYKNLEKLTGSLETMAGTDFSAMADDLEKVANKLYIITTYTPSLSDTKTKMEDLGKVKLSDLCTEMETAGEKTGEFKTTVDGNMKAIVDLFSTMITDTKSKFTAFKWREIGTDLMNKITGGIRGKRSELVSVASTVASAGKTSMQTGWNTVGSDIVRGIVAGVNGASSSLYSTLRNLAKRALQEAKNALKIGSPSKVMRDEIGKWIPAGIAEGITGSAGMVTDAMSEIAADAAGTRIAGAIAGQTASMSRMQAAGTGIDGTGSAGLMGQIVDAIKEGLENATVNSYLDGRLVTDSVNRYQGEDMTGRRFGYA